MEDSRALVASTCVLAVVYKGFLAVDRLNLSSPLSIFLAIALPLAVGKTADQTWYRLRQ